MTDKQNAGNVGLRIDHIEKVTENILCGNSTTISTDDVFDRKFSDHTLTDWPTCLRKSCSRQKPIIVCALLPSKSTNVCDKRWKVAKNFYKTIQIVKLCLKFDQKSSQNHF